MTPRDRDIAIRTILGEAANESPMGQAAVAHVLLNRASDQRWPSTVQDVALQPKQFSAWNSGAGGNNLVDKYGPGDGPYERTAAIYDQVASGQISDPTGGATHYYSPAGMQALVNEGAQGNLLPKWLQQENQRRGGDTAQIGGHIFTGRVGDADLSYRLPQIDTGTMGVNTPFSFDGGGLMGTLTGEGGEATGGSPLAGLGKALMEQSQPDIPPPMIAPMPQAQPYQPVRRDTTEPYLQLFQSLRG